MLTYIFPFVCFILLNFSRWRNIFVFFFIVYNVGKSQWAIIESSNLNCFLRDLKFSNGFSQVWFYFSNDNFFPILGIPFSVFPSPYWEINKRKNYWLNQDIELIFFISISVLKQILYLYLYRWRDLNSDLCNWWRSDLFNPHFLKNLVNR